AFSVIICAIYLFVRLLETLDDKVEKDYLQLLKDAQIKKSEMRLDTSRYNTEKKGILFIKTPDSSSVPEKYYCVLKNNMLFLFNSLNDVSAINVICFDGCSVSIVRNKVGSSKYNKKNCIATIQPERELLFHSKILHFYFESGFDLETWYWFIKEASSLTHKKSIEEEQEAKICKKFFEELPVRLGIPTSERVGSIPLPVPSQSSLANPIQPVSSTISSIPPSTSTIITENKRSTPLKTSEELSGLRERNRFSSTSTSLFNNTIVNGSGGANDTEINNQIDSIIDDYSSNISTGTSNSNINVSIPPSIFNSTAVMGSTSKYDWFNVALARVFFNFYDSETLLGFAAEKITKKINKVKKPSILKSISLQNLEFGPNIPVLNDAKLLYITPNGEFSADVAITYHGGFTMTIKIEIMISFRGHSVTIPFVISVLVKSLSGRVNVQCLPNPTKRIWIGFYEEPKCELDIDTSIGQSKTGYFANIPKLAKLIITKLKAEIFEMMVLPNRDDLPFPRPSSSKKNPSIIPNKA
ncbi:hypothetical protein CYY_010394, partial [Polysphondylium violaceum]